MTRKNIIMKSIVISIMIFSLQNALVFDTTTFKEEKKIFFYIFKISLLIIYFILVEILIREHYYYFIESTKINAQSLLSTYFSIAFVFSMSSLTFNKRDVGFNILMGIYTLVSGNLALFLIMSVKDKYKKILN